jgi:very-short-patch-repair endonuclease
MPEVNQPIFDEHGQWPAEPDLHYKTARLAIEYNGSDHATLERMRKDATRTLDMQHADWLVRIYTAIDAFRRLDGVVADTRLILARRAPDLLAAMRLRHSVTR